jgi:hypothetical protein
MVKMVCDLIDKNMIGAVNGLVRDSQRMRQSRDRENGFIVNRETGGSRR